MRKYKLAELPRLAKEIVEKLPQKQSATIVALRGSLGAGKTTFVQALARVLGVEDTVQSPTYVLMKSYPISYKHFSHLVHIDAYRLEEPQQFGQLKPDEFLNDPSNIVVVEWPERVKGVLPPPDLAIKFSSEGAQEDERFIEH